MELHTPSNATARHAFTYTRKFAFKAMAKESRIDPMTPRGIERNGWLILPVVDSIPLSLKIRPVLDSTCEGPMRLHLNMRGTKDKATSSNSHRLTRAAHRGQK